MTAIHADRLPKNAAVLAAFEDASQLEPYSRTPTGIWEYPIAKKAVAARLGKDLNSLVLAFKKYPGNEELLLLTSLVARYAGNLDIAGSQATALGVLRQAQALDPSDLRTVWFRAAVDCQTRRPKAGADEFLALENSHVWDKLSPAFWEDYMACAAATDMPDHLLRAASHLEKLHAPASQSLAALIDAARKRFDLFDPKKNYGVQELWQSANAGADDEFTSTICGVRFHARHGWKISRMMVNNGACTAGFYTGPYEGGDRSLTASILLRVMQPEKNESLQGFVRKFTEKGSFESFTPSHCPSAFCIALRGVPPGAHGDEDRNGRLVLFERNQPEFPGLAFETPSELPGSDFEKGATFFRPGQIQQRIPGKLFYLVLLDEPASVEESAMKDLDFFLDNLTVE
jgi:hypothetical protein